MRVRTLILLAMTLAACQPLSLYHKAGVSVAEAEDDRLSCEVSALKDAPVATQIRQTPGYYIPAREVCNSAGNCYLRGGYWEPGRVYSVDVNADLRRRLTDRCMAEQGYAPVSIPLCPQSVSNAVPPGATTTMPALTANSCAIRNDDGSFLIVNRG